MAELAGEVLGELDLKRLVLVVLKALVGTAVHALLAVEAVRGSVPDVAQLVDIQRLFEVTLADADATVARGRTYINISYSGFVHQFLELFFVLGADLYNDTRVLSKENLHDVVCLEVDEVDLHTALGVGEAHLQQGGDETAGADVVSSEEKTLADTFLNGIECVAEIFGVGASGDIRAHFSLTLGECTASETQLIEREVDMVECGFRLIGQHGADDLADIADFAAGSDNDGSWSNDFCAIGVLLGHREAVLTCRDVDLQGAAELRKSFHGAIESGVLTFLRAARPHPVCAEAYAVETFGQRCPDDICQTLGNGEHRTSCGVGESCLWGVAECRGNTFPAAVVKGYDTTV